MKSAKKILFTLIIIGLLGAGTYKIYKNQEETKRQTDIIAQENESFPIYATTVKSEQISSEYSTNGTLAPEQEMMLSAEMPGKVKRILVKEGDFVKAGQTLAVIKKDALQASYSSANASYQNALEDNQRFENAYKTGGVTKQQLDQSRLRLKTAKSQLDQAQIQVGDADVKTLISGYVNQKMVEPGLVVGAGTPLFQIVNVSQLKLKVAVNEAEVARLSVGDTVQIKVNVFSDKTFSGKISFIAPMADSSMSYPVEIVVMNKEDNKLKAGMYATAIFSQKNGSQKTMVLPKDAFVNGVSSHQVFTIQKDSTVKLTNVVTGRVFGEDVEILNGVKPGDKVVVSGQINLFEGSKVSIIK